MNDMAAVIIPKSDQINAEDFLAGPKTYTIEGVAISPGTEQPVQIKLAGEPRVWRPCKSMSRVLVSAWGPDASVYAGRSLTLYRDPKVKWGGLEVGGIRVSHMSHINGKMLLQLTATKGKRAPHVVEPLVAEVRQIDTAKTGPTPEEWADRHVAAMANAPTVAELDAFVGKREATLAKLSPELRQKCDDAYRLRRAEMETVSDDDLPEF